MYRLRIV